MGILKPKLRPYLARTSAVEIYRKKCQMNLSKVVKIQWECLDFVLEVWRFTIGLDHLKEIYSLVACMSLSYDNSGCSLLHERIELVFTLVVVKIFLYVFEFNSVVLKVYRCAKSMHSCMHCECWIPIHCDATIE